MIDDALEHEFWGGFDACLEMVLNTLNKSDPHVWTDLLKNQIIEEAEQYKKHN